MAKFSVLFAIGVILATSGQLLAQDCKNPQPMAGFNIERVKYINILKKKTLIVAFAKLIKTKNQ